MDEREFFDRLAPDWDDNEVLSLPEKVNKILDFMEIKPGDAILDLGTGTGVLLPHIAKRIGKAGKITAVDFSEGMIERAKMKFSDLEPRPEFLILDFENDNLSGEYDKIILYCVYPHLHTPIDTLKWLMKVNLKKNGEIYIAFPCGPDFINNIHREKHSDSDVLPTASQLCRLLSDNGLDASVVKEEDDAYIIRIRKE